jgi:hypothetical protein
MTLIRVDGAELDQLGYRMRLISTQLDAASSTFDDGYGGVRSRIIEDALADFADDWSQKRASLVEAARTAGEALQVIAAQFDAADLDLQRALLGTEPVVLPAY